MIERLLRILRASRESPDAAELADALWLAERMPERARSAMVTSPAAAPPGALAGGAGHDPPARAPIHQPAATDPLASVHLATPASVLAPLPLPTGGSGTLASAPALPAITNAAAIVRALRPLRLRVDSRVRGIVDEPATAQRIADTGLWLPELRPEPERRLDLLLIVDNSASMVVWMRTVVEFRALLIQLAAFRDVRLVSVNTDDEGAGARLADLTGPPGRRLILVLSDCVGRAWAEGTMLRSLEHIGCVAIVQMLPQRLWAGCGLSFVPVRISGSLLDGLRVEQRNGEHAPAEEGLPVPVLELDARWLSPWAAVIAGQAVKPIASMAVFTRSASVPAPPHGQVTAYDRVTLFRSVASPTAVRLAALLAAAPLSLPVMRLVQHVMLPRSRPADLAEVFLSGLFRRVAEPDQAMVEFEFYPGVREILLGTLRRAEAVRVLQLISAHIGERLGSPPEFPALFTPGSTGRARLTEPFARLALTVLRSVGGQYRELADKIAKDLIDRPGFGVPRISWDPAAVQSRVPSISSTASISSTGGLTVAETTVARSPALWRGVPPKNPNFIGREDLLLALRSQLSAGITALVPIALHGLGGVGKTQIAIEYVYRFAADYDLICWVSGEVPTQLRSDLAAIAPELKIPTGGDLELTLAAVCDALRRGEPYNHWLLVVDNADVPSELLPYLPQAGGHILITSRNQTWDGYAQTFQVAEFTRDESISLILRRGKGISHEDANVLADRLGDLPIAVEQAAAWQAQSGMSVRRYLALLEKEITAVLSENPPPGYNVSVVAAWRLAFDDLQSQSPEGAALVQLCAFLGPEAIPYALLWSFRHATDIPAELESMVQDDFRFARAVRLAGQRALIKVDPARETLSEHRLVQAVLRERLSPERQAEMVRLVWKLLIVANPGRPDHPNNWDMLATISLHLGPSGIIDADDRMARSVIIDQIRFLYNRGDYIGSSQLGQEMVRRWRESPGASDEQTLVACRLVGIVLREFGLMDQARVMNEDTLERTRAVFGPEDEHTLVTANSYACDLRVTGAYADALELDETLLRQHKRVFGDNEESTLRSAHNLALDMRLNDRYTQAYELDLDTLNRRREQLGDERWETWSSAGAVAVDLRGMGEYTESARYFEEAIARCSDLLDPEHPETIRIKMGYATTLRRLGRFEEARELAEACLELNLRRLDERHNYTLAMMSTLAEVLRLLGHGNRALELAGRVVAAAPATYGEGHLLVTTCEHNYAVKLRAVGEDDRAYAIDRTANDRFGQARDEHRRRSASSDMSLARDLQLRGDTEAALRLLTQARQASGQVRGVNHPRTLFCAANLAALQREAGEQAEADSLMATVMPALRERLGPEHPEVVMAQAGEFIEFEMEIPDR